MSNYLPTVAATSGHNFYQIAKDFLPSISTVMAAIAAVLITLLFNMRFNRRQAATALRAVNIAHDRLRFDLFEKRYKIYAAARRAIDITLDKCDEDKFPSELDILFISFEESRFFFPEDTYSFLNQLRKDINTFLNQNSLHRQKAAQSVGAQSVEARKIMLDEEAKILKLQEELYTTSIMLPKKFSDVLGFPQLIGKDIVR